MGLITNLNIIKTGRRIGCAYLSVYFMVYLSTKAVTSYITQPLDILQILIIFDSQFPTNI
jgi:hypothetical protein